MTVAKPLATVAKLQGRMNFIKYKDELINLDLCNNIYISVHNFDDRDHLIFFGSVGLEGEESIIASLDFKTKKERDEYFLKIQKRIENIQGFKVELGGEND